MTAEELVFGLLSDPAILAAAAEGVLTPGEQERLVWPTSTSDGQVGPSGRPPTPCSSTRRPG